MEVLWQKKKQWEYENQRVLIRLAQAIADVSVQSVKAAGLFTSFLLYLVYIVIRGMLAVSAILFYGPKLVRHVGPNERPQQIEEIQAQQLELQLRSNTRGWRE
jgi:hypothetical protein